MILETFRVYCLIFLTIHSSYGIPRVKRALGAYNNKLWTGNIIPYITDNSFSDSDKLNLQKAIESYQAETCLKFVKYQPNIHANWLKIEKGENCFSQIGMQNTGEQLLTLSKACRQYGVVVHELGHTIGLLHEMMRPDRNQHIRYIDENVQEEAKIGFEIESNHYKLFNTPFDFQSIMLYSPYAFSKNGFPVWLKMNSSDRTPIFDISEKDLSFWDVKAINDLYQCGKNCSNTQCSSGNYVDKNCACQTPEMFSNRRCVDDTNNMKNCLNASETNICYNEPISASVMCRKTCGRCFRYGDYGNGSPPPYKCVDIDVDQCQRKKDDGFCYVDTWTKVYCKKSCNTCGNHSDTSTIEFLCKDRHNSHLCEDWAEKGQCSINPGFMKANCALSCGTCSTNMTAKKPNAPCRNYSPDSYCDAMFRENKCNGTTLKICLGSCGKCGKNYERNEPNKTEQEVAKSHAINNRVECKDLVSNCQYFANDGQCQKYKETMKYHCAKSCNFCSHKLCKNEDSDDVCDAVSQRGLCTAHAGFANRCQRTCQICQVEDSKSLDECKDLDSLHICQEIVRRNQCNTDRGQRCLNSCNLCNQPMIAATTLPSMESVTMVECVNEDSEETCEHLKERGLCQSYLNRAVLCRKSCNLCALPKASTSTPIICLNVEDDETCNSWASTGYCFENKEYMKENCAKACKFCFSKDTTISPSTANTHCRNKQTSEVCISWVAQGYCGDHEDHMRINCLESCGYCNKSFTVTPIKTTVECKNTESDELCESWRQNYCSVSHIADLCKKTCNIC